MELTYFPHYHNVENQITNYCGLILKMIYESSPSRCQDVLAAFCGEDNNIRIGPSFRQQEKKGPTIPDLLISQSSIEIRFEAKRDEVNIQAPVDADPQIPGHLKHLAETNATIKVLIILSKTAGDDESDNQMSAPLQLLAQSQGVQLLYRSFQQYMEVLRNSGRDLTHQIDRAIDEFEEYLQRQAVLEDWQQRIDIVPTGKTIEQEQAGIYTCPAASVGAAHSHRRSKYMGTYREKQIRDLYEVRGCVLVEGGSRGTIQWMPSGEAEADLISVAVRLLNEHRKDDLLSNDWQVFLLKNHKSTSIRYDLGGGIQIRRYVKLPVHIKTISEAARYCAGKTWSELPKD